MTDTPYADPAVQLRLRHVTKSHGATAAAVLALSDVNLDIPPGSFTAVMGPSGSGKTTLLQCAAGLDTVDSGTVTVAGTRIDTMTANALTRLRRDRLGFIFQSFNLLPALTVAHNITLPFELANRRPDPGEYAALVHRLGLTGLLGRRPAELSGGQRQRVAVARALLGRPAVIFADEPTGALDTDSAAAVMRLLREAVDHYGRTIVMVTHDPVAAAIADTTVFFADGRIRDLVSGLTAPRLAERLTGLAAAPARPTTAAGV